MFATAFRMAAVTWCLGAAHDRGSLSDPDALRLRRPRKRQSRTQHDERSGDRCRRSRSRKCWHFIQQNTYTGFSPAADVLLLESTTGCVVREAAGTSVVDLGSNNTIAFRN